MLKHGILGLLNYSDMTGYEIMEVFRDSLNFFWSAQTSQIYRELQTLKERGWVEVTTVEQIGKPNKNVFSINSAGKEELLNWLSQELNTPARYPMLMKVFFLGERSPEENIAFFEQLKQDSAKSLEVIFAAERISESYEAGLCDLNRTQYWDMANLYGRMRMEMVMSWCDICIDKIRGRK